MDEADMDAHPDTVLAGRYRLLATLGAGGMGTVWRASDELLDREVAVKLFAPASGHSGDEARRRTEMHLLAGTAHPAVVALFDAQLEGDPAYLVMELVDGEDLATRLTRGPVPPAQTRGIGLAMAAALESLARRGAVHRDVKPSNILLPGEGSALPAKLADFGIARLADDAGLTTAGTTIGTAAYLSPEQVAGREPTPKADVYSLGLVLLECLTGERAFPGTVSETAAARLVREPTVPPELGADWQGLLTAMCRMDPDERIDAREALARLGRMRAASAAPPATTPATVPVASVSDATGPTARLPVVAGAGMAAGAAAAGAAAAEPTAPVDAGVADAPPARRTRRGILITAVAVVAAVIVAAIAIALSLPQPHRTPAPPALTGSSSASPSITDGEATGRTNAPGRIGSAPPAGPTAAPIAPSVAPTGTPGPGGGTPTPAPSGTSTAAADPGTGGTTP